MCTSVQMIQVQIWRGSYGAGNDYIKTLILYYNLIYDRTKGPLSV